ncbi:hypothetical protein [Mucilaginibacter auburnensis]|nr:hypothetical protein [Mucilaginibacter auburnensis]
MRVYKQFYMIFVLLRACLWNVSISFAGNVEAKLSAEGVDDSQHINRNIIMVSASDAVYAADNFDEAEQHDFLRTQVSRVTALPVFHRDRIYNRKNLNGERVRFLRLLLFPNHSFG